MKTLTTLTAVAALIAGMSIASAQTSPSTSMDKGAAATKMAPAAESRCQQWQVLHQDDRGGVLELQIREPAACKKAAKPNSADLQAESETRHHRLEVISQS